MKDNKSYLIVGLGNPGPKYHRTRHNVGFRFLDHLSEKLNVKFREKSQYFSGSCQYEDKKLVFLKPMMYMNLSGIPVLHVASYYKIKAENIIIAYDDVALSFGRIRIRKQGSAGGHNGIKSIIENLGKDNFNRLRIGVGNADNIPLDRYVLSNFAKSEEEKMDDLFELCEKALMEIIDNGAESAMNRYNSSELAES